jgi:hypothetical protein
METTKSERLMLPQAFYMRRNVRSRPGCHTQAGQVESARIVCKQNLYLSLEWLMRAMRKT